jgi:hypothetical protein
MVHQVAADLVRGVSDPVRRSLARGVEKEARRLDGMGGEDEHLCSGSALAAVPALEANAAHPAVGADFNENRRRPLIEGRARSDGAVDVDGGVVLA